MRPHFNRSNEASRNEFEERHPEHSAEESIYVRELLQGVEDTSRSFSMFVIYNIRDATQRDLQLHNL